MYYTTCPYCGANLDPCERCDCGEKNVTTKEVSTVCDDLSQAALLTDEEEEMLDELVKLDPFEDMV